MSDQNEINYTKEAFLHPFNLVFLVVGLVLALVVGLGDFGMSPGFHEMLFNLLLLGLTASELLVLGTVPRQPRFRRYVKSKQVAEWNKPPSQREMYRQLKRRNQRRYVRLRNIEQQIRTNYQQLSYASQGLLDSHLKKIGGLLDSYLKLLLQKERYEAYSDSATESDIVRAIEALQKDMADDSDRVRNIKERRLHILEQRLKRFKKSAENQEIIEAQLETIEDVIKYIHEQSWTLQNPEEITFQLDTLLDEVRETQESVAELEDVFGQGSGRLSILDSFEEDLGLGTETTPSQRERTRS